MSQLVNTQAHRAARNAASIALADVGVGNASIKLYSTQGGTLRATRSLAKPCGSIRPSDGRLVLIASENSDVAESTGPVTWGEWCNGNGNPISAGRVTDPDGNITDGTDAVVPDPEGLGPFVLGNLDPAVTGTKVYAGGLVILYAGLIG